MFLIAAVTTALVAIPVPVRRPVQAQAEKSDAIFATDKRPVVLFDGVCNLCNFWVNFCLDNDPYGKLRFAALQSEAGRALLERSGRNADDISSIVLVTPDTAYVKANAVLEIAERIEATLPIARLAPLARLVPPPLADAVYDVVADNRYEILGHRDMCRVTDDGFGDRFVA